MIYLVSRITWYNGNMLWLLMPLLFFLTLVLIQRFYSQQQKVYSLVALPNIQKFFLHFSPTKKRFKIILLISSLFFLVLALARPQWDREQQLISQEARDVLIALDISRSMLAQDLLPNRLEWSKAKVKKLIHALNSERVGLILFSGDAFVQCPLTADSEAVFNFLDSVTTETISSGATALDKAIDKAITIFSNTNTRKSKLLILFTDGEDFSLNLQSVKQKAQSAGLHIFTFGVGTSEGAPIPLIDNNGAVQGHQKDEKGSTVISRLNEQLLQSLSQMSGALYVRTTQDDKDCNIIVNKVKKFEKEKVDDTCCSLMQDRYYYFGIISLAFLLIEWLL